MTEIVKQRGGNDKRRRILDGALRAFARKGFYNTKVSEIASEAGVADGTIYLYFKNKDDLLISLFEDRMEWAIDRLQAELGTVDVDHPQHALEKIRVYVQLHCTLAAEDKDLAEFLTVELRQSTKFVKEYSNPKFGDYLRILQGIIEEGQERGQIRRDLDSKVMSRAIFGALDEVLLQLTLSRTPPRDVQRKAQQIAVMFIEGMQAH